MKQRETKMTQIEAIEKLTSKLKWYDGHYSQSHASKLIKSIKNNKMPADKMIAFFAKFGYEVKIIVK